MALRAADMGRQVLPPIGMDCTHLGDHGDTRFVNWFAVVVEISSFRISLPGGRAPWKSLRKVSALPVVGMARSKGLELLNKPCRVRIGMSRLEKMGSVSGIK
jgi:hypothetical protein